MDEESTKSEIGTQNTTAKDKLELRGDVRFVLSIFLKSLKASNGCLSPVLRFITSLI